MADEGRVGAVCWFYKRNDVYLFAGRGELMYSLKYSDSKDRLLTLDRFHTLVKRYPGRIISILKFQRYQSMKEKLPKLLFLKTNVKNTHNILPKDGFTVASH
jgi:4-amino-4-deoxy-L-arabinose transferase